VTGLPITPALNPDQPKLTVIKNMPQVRSTLSVNDLNPRHPGNTAVHNLYDVILIKGLIEAGPTSTRIKLGV
jgi:hypothetical protein